MALATLVLTAVAAASPLAPISLYRVAWEKPLVTPVLLEWKPEEPGGPAVAPGRGVVVVGTRDGGVRAYRRDGAALWEVVTGGPILAAPSIDGETVYVGGGDGKLRALALADGKERWSYDCKEEIGSPPVLAKGVVLFSTHQDTIFAVDAASGAWKWHQRRETKAGFTIRGVAAPAVAGETVYAAWSDGTVAALDLFTGKPRWERKVAPSGGFPDVDSTPRLRGQRLFVAAYSGAVLALDARTGRVEWEFRVPAACRLLLGKSVVMAVTATDVVGLTFDKGTRVWSVPLQGTPAAEPVAVGSYALVPAANGLLFLDERTGRRLRVFDPGTGVSASPAADGQRLYVLSNGGSLFALDLR
jgi:outer membrane protein assembly factor BamB